MKKGIRIPRLAAVSLFMAFCLMFTPISVQARAIAQKPMPEETIDQTVDENYVPPVEFVDPIEVKMVVPEGYTGIYSATEFHAINDNPDGKYILMKDIDVQRFNEDGYGLIIKPFTGEFDGNGHSITGVDRQTTPMRMDVAHMGLFRELKGGTIKNLKVSGTYLVYNLSDNSTLYTGGIVGLMDNGTVENCVSDTTFTLGFNGHAGDDTNYAYMGGVVGEIYDQENTGLPSKITSCVFTGGMRGYMNVGGIVGLSAQAGVEISRCMNYGKLSNGCDMFTYIGGMLGRMGQSNASSELPVVISECVNYGSVDSITCGGGMVGLVTGEAPGCLQIVNCLNTAPISVKSASSDAAAGGLVGYTVNGSSVSLESSVTEGKLNGATQGDLCGATEDGEEPSVKNCYAVVLPEEVYLYEDSMTPVLVEKPEKTEEATPEEEEWSLHEKDMFTQLNFDEIWAMDGQWHGAWYYAEQATELYLKSLFAETQIVVEE